jgi:hypothetical protein
MRPMGWRALGGLIGDLGEDDLALLGLERADRSG